MRIAIRHELSLTPPPGTANMVVQVLLTPREGPTQRVERWQVEMEGIEAAARFDDAFGNPVHFTNLMRPETEIAVTASGVVETIDTTGVLGRPAGEPVPALYLRPTTLTRVPASLYARLRPMRTDRLSLLHALMARIGEVLGGGEAGAEAQSQSEGEEGQTQSQRAAPAGAGADAALLAHGFVGAARALDIPARYVSGYLLDETASGLHAWAEAFDPGLGWIGFDPALQLCPTTSHVRLGTGLDALSTTPLRAVPAGDGFRLRAVSVTAA